MIKIIRLEKHHLKRIKTIRNSNIQYLRQWKYLNMLEQEKWFNENKNDIYFTLFDKSKIVGAIGLTYIDYISRLSEVSLITEDYIDDKYAKYGVNFL